MKRKSAGCPEAINSGSLYLPSISMGVRKRRKRDLRRTRIDMGVVYGGIGGFSRGLFILVLLHLLSGERAFKRTREPSDS